MFQKFSLFLGLMAVVSQAAITGYVRLPDTTPVSSIQVTLKSTEQSTQTDANGYFSIEVTSAFATQSAGTKIAMTGEMLHFNLIQNNKVCISTYTIQGKRVGKDFQEILDAGSYSISPFPTNLPAGLYIVRVVIGNKTLSFKANYSGRGGERFISSQGALRKTLAIADSLQIGYENQSIGSIAIFDDDAAVDDLVISHKVISGLIAGADWNTNVSIALTSSDGLNETLSATFNFLDKTYSATSIWTLYNANRTWDITVSSDGFIPGNASAISDATQNVILNLEPTISSSSSQITSSSNISSSSSNSVYSSTSSYTIADMPSSLATFVNWVWDNRQASGKMDDIVRSQNLLFHQIIEAKGNINYCVRWQSKNALSQSDRDKTVKMISSQLNTWVKELQGYENWPYDTVYVKVIGWAADNASKFTDLRSDEKVYTAYTESDGTFPTLPRCPDACNRMEHYTNKSYDYSSCEGGERFDMSLWITDDFVGGTGGDWGQRTSYSDFSYAINSSFPQIIGHETGHGFGLDDFYETYQIPNSNYDPLPCNSYATCETSGYDGNWDIVPLMVMRAGSSPDITETDAWMLRRTWTGVKNQFGY